MAGVLGTPAISRIRIVVKDVDVATDRWAAFLGIAPEVGPADVGKGPAFNVNYRGEPAPFAEIRATLFRVAPNFYVELMQPNGVPSVWQDELDRSGEGLHSIGFFVDSVADSIAASEEFGAEVLQTGEFGTGDGRYAYMDFRRDLKAIVEIEQTDRPFQEILDAAKRSSVE
jgi:methylmalonyl-CoA/ethylmalonyl-CoA epimerase